MDKTKQKKKTENGSVDNKTNQATLSKNFQRLGLLANFS